MGISTIVASVTEALSAVGSTVAAGATELGIGASTAGALGFAAEGALTGGAIGAATNWKNPLKGAASGALTGATIGGLGPEIGSFTGLGATAGDTLAGALGGTLGGLATGENLGTSALKGAAGGLATGLTTSASPSLGTSGSATTAPTATGVPVSGGVGSAAGLAAPTSVMTPGADVSEAVGVTGTKGALDSALPGSVGAGAAGGTPSLAGGTQTSGKETGGSEWGKFLTSPQGLLTIGSLGASAAQGQKQPAGVEALTTQANQLTAQGNRLNSYLTTGTLPPGLQQGLTTATNDAQTAIKSKYASMGMSGSSAEAQDLQSVAMRAEEQGASQAMQLMQMGTQDLQLGSQLYEYLIGVNMQQDQQLSTSISNFASAFAEMGRPTTAQGVGA